jgi:hypothetical protein
MAKRSRTGKAARRAAITAALLLVAAVQAGASPRTSPAEPPNGRGTAFRIAATVRGLAPGVTKTMRVLVHNPYPFAIRVTSISAEATSTDRPGCDGSELHLEPFYGELNILAGARARARHRMAVRMDPEAPDACQGATFTISYRGTAVEG